MTSVFVGHLTNHLSQALILYQSSYLQGEARDFNGSATEALSSVPKNDTYSNGGSALFSFSKGQRTVPGVASLGSPRKTMKYVPRIPSF